MLLPILDDSIDLYVEKALENDEAHVVTDEIRVKQILTSFLNNAVKFTEKGQISFGYRINSDKNILFYVQDTGIGILPDDQSFIFDRFRQVESNLNRKYGGTGLGLAIAKGLVGLLKGKIWVESEISKGSVFYFTIPLEKSEHENLQLLKPT